MSEILINTSTAGSQQHPTVADLFGTHYLICWSDQNDGTIRGHAYQANGTPTGSEFVVNGTARNPVRRTRPTATNTPFGPVVAWIEEPTTPGQHYVKVQRFGQTRNRVGDEIKVSSHEIDPMYHPALTNVSDGFVVAWIDSRFDHRIRARRFGPDGAPVGAEFQINTGDGFHESPIATTLGGGNYVIAWRTGPEGVGGGRLAFRIFEPDGTAVTGEVRPNLSGFTRPKAITALHQPFFEGGQLVLGSNFALAYVRALPNDQSRVYAGVYGVDGTEQVIAVPATDAPGITSSSPALATLSNGKYLVSWVQSDGAGVAPSVRARVFDVDHGPIGTEVKADTGTATERRNLSAGAVFDGGEGDTAFLAWADEGGAAGDTSGLAVRGRTFTVTSQGQLL
ncbi:hypothetical protein Q5762_23405 [Streptomyces sp. P9(2023)]|uniref:hypothetical protein n=1 Tax=Streptomyces sp. P9(2023) TaxID=3064394 RepID=UPI0028F3EDE5|nr:hypothetical protein [Streptomyces sp. P9(2023)]MDT9691241.1 hypothetical protein [Streptomyces sp. P9(2023)]